MGRELPVATDSNRPKANLSDANKLGNLMKEISIIGTLLLLVGCASVNEVPSHGTGQSMDGSNPNDALSSLEKSKATVIKAATSYCSSLGKNVKFSNVEDSGKESSIHFECVE
jgi:hypothetical protein